MPIPGVDFGTAAATPEMYEQLAADRREFAVRYLSDAPPTGRHSRGEAELAASHGIRSGHVWENDGSNEVWYGRTDGAAPGFETGRACAEIARDQQREIAGRGGLPILFAIDKVTSIDGRGTSWKIGPALEFLRGTRSVIGLARNGVYGTGYTCRQAKGLCSWFWLSWLLEGVYDGGEVTPSSDVPWVQMLQHGNADRDSQLPRYAAVGEHYSYVGHDKAVNGATLADLPVWLPT